MAKPDERGGVQTVPRLQYEDGRAIGPGGRIVFARSFRIRVLEFLASGGSKRRAVKEFKITPVQLKRILDGEGGAGKPKPSILKLEQAVVREKTLRDQLYQKAVDATSAALDSNDDYRRGVIGVKVLEGLGDFRRAGDEIPRDVPRQPLFNLPAGSHVAIEIRTGRELPAGNIPALEGEKNGSDDGSATQCGAGNSDACDESGRSEDRPPEAGMEDFGLGGVASQSQAKVGDEDGLYFDPGDIRESDAEYKRPEAVGSTVQVREPSSNERDHPGELVREG